MAKTHGGLVPLSVSSPRFWRLTRGISLVQLSAASGVSLRKLSLEERGRLALNADEKRRRDDALEQLAKSTPGPARAPGVLEKEDR